MNISGYANLDGDRLMRERSERELIKDRPAADTTYSFDASFGRRSVVAVSWRPMRRPSEIF